MVAVLAFVFLHERPSVTQWSEILMVGAGVLILSFRRRPDYLRAMHCERTHACND
jgi:drug/metabolite transporter (DMT)-like permease